MRATLALMTRAIRHDARSWRTYAARGALVLIQLLALSSATIQFAGATPAGLRYFTAVVATNWVFILLVSLHYFGSAIAEEKEDGTLTLLRMTRLSPLAILLGKAASRLLGVAMLLLAQLPFTLLAVTLGGVSTTQVLAAYVALFGFSVLLGAICLLASTIASSTRRAAGLAGVMLFTLFAGPWIALRVISWYDANAAWSLTATLQGLALWTSQQWVGTRLTTITATGFAGPIIDTTSPATDQLLGNLGLAVACFAFNWAAFDRLTLREQPVLSRGAFLPVRKTRATQRVVWSSPLAWKDYHFVAGGTRYLIFKFLGYGALMAAIALFSETRLRNAHYVVIWVAIPAAILEVAVIASRVYAVEVREQTLPVLRMLPLSTAEWAYGKLGGALLGAAPVLLWLGLGMLPELDELFDNIVFDFDGFLAFGVFVALVVAYWHLTALLSLYTRGAVILAAIATFMGFYASMTVLMLILFGLSRGGPPDEMVFRLIALGGIGALGLFCATIHVAVGSRLEALSQR